MVMDTWKAHKVKKSQKGSQTTGKSKGIVSSPLQRYMCRSNRSYKHPLYQEIMGHGLFQRRTRKS